MHTSVSPAQCLTRSCRCSTITRKSDRLGKRFLHEARLGLTVLILLLLTPKSLHGQACRGNINEGCTNPGAVCSPVSIGTGPTGHCKTPEGLPKGERECACVGKPIPPPPSFDPRCSDRSATGKFICTITKPDVRKRESDYRNVVFAPNDVVDVYANGCVQTGGVGSTWKRYVNPSGPESARYYHGLVRIPTSQENQGGLVRISQVIGRHLHVTGNGLPVSQLYLHLGYEDEDYSDNGYNDHDDGTEDQCKITNEDPLSGGPAYVIITIYRGVAPDNPQSSFNFDVLSSQIDQNGLPYNPSWSWQLRPENAGQKPGTSMCHEFSKRGSTLGVPDEFMSPYVADCTDQADLSTVDEAEPGSLCWYRLGTAPYIGDRFAGHVNWFPITVEGRAGWGDHSGWPYPFGDDDYTFTFVSDNAGSPLSINGRPGLHVEFDSDETIDHFQDPSPLNEWKTLRDRVDNNGDVAQIFDGHTILTGMFGVDTEHDLKAELHPLYALATRRDNFENGANDEAWLMFVRNQGDEGYCSTQIWDSGLEDYTFQLPWRPGAASVTVDWNKTFFSGTTGTSGPFVTELQSTGPIPKPVAALVRFHLGPAGRDSDGSVPFIYGVLHLQWSGPVSEPLIAARPVPPAAGTAENEDEVEHQIAKAIRQLPPADQATVTRARRVPVTRPIVTHRLAPTGPVRKLSQAPRVARVGRLHAIKGGPAMRKLARDAAQMHAICAATQNKPQGLPPEVCQPRRPVAPTPRAPAAPIRPGAHRQED
jgi:hypothetical protein